MEVGVQEIAQRGEPDNDAHATCPVMAGMSEGECA